MRHDSTVLTDDEYNELCGVLRERAGVELESTRRFAIGSRVTRRVRELGLGDASQYLSFLRMGPHRSGELDELLRLAIMNETVFGRYPRQLEALERTILPELIASRRHSRRLRIWSAGCASGQEAYDLAMIVRRVLGVRIDDWDARVLATDISGRALETARHAWYAAPETRMMSRDDLETNFMPERGGYRVREGVRGMVSFRTHNLRDSMAARRLVRFDVICCRNVLCHMNERLRGDALCVLHDRLVEDGVLLVGHRDGVEHAACPFTAMGEASWQAWRAAA